MRVLRSAVVLCGPLLALQQQAFAQPYTCDNTGILGPLIDTSDDEGTATERIDNGRCLLAGASGNVCTSQSVKLGAVTNIELITACSASASSTGKVEFYADVNFDATSNKVYDVGLHFGPTNTGLCYNVGLTCVGNTDFELDGDVCDDISKGLSTFTRVKLTAPCDGSGDDLKIPYCTSWRNNQGVVCSDVDELGPDESSKCNCPVGSPLVVEKQCLTTYDVETTCVIDDAGFYTDTSVTITSGLPGQTISYAVVDEGNAAPTDPTAYVDYDGPLILEDLDDTKLLAVKGCGIVAEITPGCIPCEEVDDDDVSIGFVSVQDLVPDCTGDTNYDIPIVGIPAPFSATYKIKDDMNNEVGVSVDGNTISALLTPGAKYTIEVSLSKDIDGVAALCQQITLLFEPTCCADSQGNPNDGACPPGLICCPERLVCDEEGDTPGACGDPHMTGFLGQKFDFTGEDGEWYALIADEHMNINMRVSCPVVDLPEITYITGLSVLTTDADGFDHSIVIEVKDPHNLDSSCPAGVSPCLADGSLAVLLDGEEALLAPGTASLGNGVEVSAVNLPGACRSFGFEKYWELKKLEYAAHARRLGEPLTMGEWVLGDPTVTNMAECEEYMAHAEAGGEGGLFAHQSEHASFQIVTPKGTVRLSHGRLHQIAMRDPTDQYDLPDHLTWQMNMAVDHNEVSRDARGILGETFVPTRDADGKPIMTGMEAIRGTQEDYRVDGAHGMEFVQDAHSS